MRQIAQGRMYFNQILLYSTHLGSVRGLYNPENKLTQYKLITNEIVAQEVLTPLGKQLIKLRYQHDPDLHRRTNSLLFGLTLDDVCEDVNPVKGKKTGKETPYSDIFIFNNHALACEKF